MPKADFKSKPSKKSEVKKRNVENFVAENRDAIDHAMKIADLQVELLKINMEKMTPKKIEAFFKQYGEDPIVKRLKERALCILKIRNDLNDEELLQAIFDLKPIGSVDIQATPVSISMDFHNPVDWARVMIKKPLFKGLMDFLFPKGDSATRDFTVKNRHDGTSEKYEINVNYQRVYGFASLQRVKKHELRHSINHEVSNKGYRHWSWEDQFDEKDEKLAEIIIKDLAQVNLTYLKDELSSFIVAGNKSKFFLKYCVFLVGPIGSRYDFKKIPDSFFWDFWKRKGLRESVIERVKKELPKRINVTEIIERSYKAVKLLERKGYSRDWAVSFLCVGDNLTKDWLMLAEACPSAKTRKVR